MELLILLFLLVFLIAPIIGLLPAAIARSKGYSFVGWWIYGSLLFIVALPHALFLQEEPRLPTGQTRYGTNITQIFIRANNQQHGPYPVGHVRAWLDSGRLKGTALAWHEGCPDWMPVSSMFETDRPK